MRANNPAPIFFLLFLELLIEIFQARFRNLYSIPNFAVREPRTANAPEYSTNSAPISADAWRREYSRELIGASRVNQSAEGVFLFERKVGGLEDGIDRRRRRRKTRRNAGLDHCADPQWKRRCRGVSAECFGPDVPRTHAGVHRG